MKISDKKEQKKLEASRPKHKGGRPKLAVKRIRKMKVRLSNKEELLS